MWVLQVAQLQSNLVREVLNDSEREKYDQLKKDEEGSPSYESDLGIRMSMIWGL